MRKLFLVLMVVVAALVPQPAAAITYMSENYEVADFAALQAKGWTLSCNNVDIVGNPSSCTLSLVPSPFGTGTALKKDYCTSSNCADSTETPVNSHIIRSIGPATEIWDTWNFRWGRDNPALPMSTGGIGNGLKMHYINSGFGDDDPTAWIIMFGGTGTQSGPSQIWMGNSRKNGPALPCPNGSTDVTCNFHSNTGTAVQTVEGVSYCIESHIKLNTPGVADGVFEMYVNGVRTHYYPSALFVASSAANSRIRSMMPYRQGGMNVNVWEDNHVVGDSRVGCSGSADITAPAQVQGLASTGVTSSSASMSWSSAEPGATYLVKRCTGAGCTNYLEIGQTTSLSYTDSTVLSSQTYRYVVSARDAALNEGANSSPIQVTAASATGISVVSSNSSGQVNSSSLAPFQMVMPSVSYGLMLVCYGARGATAANLAGAGVTSDLSGAFTAIPGATATRSDSGGIYFRSQCYYKTGPAVGTHNITVNLAGAASSYVVGAGLAFSGVSQSSPIDGSANGSNASTGISTSVATVSDNAWIADLVLAQAGSLAIGSGQTERIRNTGTDDVVMSTVNGKTPPGAEVMDHTQADAQNWVHSVVALAPFTPIIVAPTAVTGLSNITLNGVTALCSGDPESLRVQTDLGSAILTGISCSPSYVLSRAWVPGETFVCIFAINSEGVENGTDYVCAQLPPIPQIDITPPSKPSNPRITWQPFRHEEGIT